jgi:probable F420-dependent oxidoreductase
LSAKEPRLRAEWIAFARRLENLGYDRLLMPDHFGPRLAIAPALVLAAQATSRLRVGSLVYDNDFRHPAVLAQEVATIDLLTEGRFDFGIGAGWLKAEYDAAGLPFDPGRKRVERLGEAVNIVKRLLREEAVTFSGQHYQLKGLSAGFRTIQQPHPPLLIGGGGRQLLALAAREADAISVMPRSSADGSGIDPTDGSEAAFGRKIEWIKEAAGARFASLELSTLVQAVTITDDRGAAAARMAVEWQQSSEAMLDSPLFLIGSVDQIIATLERRRARLGITTITVFEKDIDRLAPVIERIAR